MSDLRNLLEQIRQAAGLNEASTRMVDDILNFVGDMDVGMVQGGRYEVTAWAGKERAAKRIANAVKSKWGDKGVMVDVTKVAKPADEDGKFMINVRLPK